MSTEAMRKALEALEKFAAWTKAENNHAGTTFGQRIEMMREADAARDEAIPLLRAALAAPEPGAWRPIETAPAGMDLLLGWWHSDGTFEQEVSWAVTPNTCPPGSGMSNGSAHGKATHWMPLPAAPSAAPPSPQPEQAPVTKQWCQEHPSSAAYIINTLAARLDAQPEPEPTAQAKHDQATEVQPPRDAHFGGHSYEASMLRNLLARIHGDGGHYVEQHGLDKALEDADKLVADWRAALAAQAPAEPVSLQRCNCPNIGYCDGSCAPYIGGPDEDTGAAVIAAASQWWCEREVTDWDSADLAKAIIRHEGDWLGCPDCDHSTCDEPCTPATVAEQLRGVDCQVAQLVHDGKLYAPEGYAPPDGWKPVEVRRKRADEPANWRMRIAAIAAECSDMDTTDALDELLEETPAEPAPVRVAMTLAGYFINTGSPGQPRWREVDRSYRTNGAVVRLYRSDDHYGIPDTNTTGDAA